MRGANSELFAMNNTLGTINAAAAVIASSENRFSQARTVQKRKWGSFWSLYWCFGSNNKYNKRFGHAVLVPEPSPQTSNPPPAPANPIQEPSRTLPFIAPPSSPASFFQSEPPSATQSPACSLSFASNMYSPSGPRSIFAIGPYSHETQLVSPPVFSTFTTEPSTAPFTPPPESVQLTTPSSPEVPFARLLDPQYRTGDSSRWRFPQSHYEFQSYQLYPGSPVGQLISPSSCISGSGTSSPFLDPDYGGAATNLHYLEFRNGRGPPKLILDKLSNHEWGSRLGSGSWTPDAASSKSRDSFIPGRQYSQAPNVEMGLDHRVSFELTSGDVLRCVEKKIGRLTKAVSESFQNLPETVETKESLGDHTSNDDDETEKVLEEEEEGNRYESRCSITLESIKEFNFDSADGGHSDKTNTGWSFFPAMKPGFS